jgi:hypothetical protein
VNVAWWVQLRPVSVTGVASQTASGPATPSSCPPVRRIQGTTWP